MARPAVATLALFLFIAKWNDYLWPLIVTNTENMRTLPVGLVFLRTSEGSINWNVVMAATVFVIAPIMLLFVLLQKYFVQGVTQSGIKG